MTLSTEHPLASALRLRRTGRRRIRPISRYRIIPRASSDRQSKDMPKKSTKKSRSAAAKKAAKTRATKKKKRSDAAKRGAAKRKRRRR